MPELIDVVTSPPETTKSSVPFTLVYGFVMSMKNVNVVAASWKMPASLSHRNEPPPFVDVMSSSVPYRVVWSKRSVMSKEIGSFCRVLADPEAVDDSVGPQCTL